MGFDFLASVQICDLHSRRHRRKRVLIDGYPSVVYKVILKGFFYFKVVIYITFNIFLVSKNTYILNFEYGTLKRYETPRFSGVLFKERQSSVLKISISKDRYLIKLDSNG